MKITNRLNLPDGFVRAVSTEKHNAAMCLSATTLIQGVKQIILSERHWEELSDDAADRIWAVFGTSVHALLQREGENEFTEQDMAWQVGPVTVTGRIDNYDMKNAVIADYKTASVWKVKYRDFDDWYRQGMIYSWLLTKNGFNVESCRFIALLKDHSKTDAERDHTYPRNPVYVYEFPVTFLNLIKIETYIKNKVREYARCLELADDGIPPCAPEERWDKAAKYAVMKTGRKTAVRLLDNKEEAERMAGELGDKHYVEARPGESAKCKNYCLCCRFCSYYQEHVNFTENAAAA